MNSHYIPRLLLRQFVSQEKVNTYNFLTDSFAVKKLKNTFAQKDIFDKELEEKFATQIEGPFADLLNHKLLRSGTIQIDRRENMLIRKFLMLNFLRAPILNNSWKDMVEKTRMQEHPTVQAKEFLERHHPEAKEWFDTFLPSEKTYLSDLKMAMETDSIEELANPTGSTKVSPTLRLSAAHALVTAIAFWDCEDAEQEFVFPKLPGISQSDQVSIFYKSRVLLELKEKKKKEGMPWFIEQEINQLQYGVLHYTDNFSIYPISPTRVLICFSPYFKAFFPLQDALGEKEVHAPLLDEKQFGQHFFKTQRMELFRPCRNLWNKQYSYEVKALTREEVFELNSMLLDMETEEFVFRDFNKLRDSFWYYDHKAKFAQKKKHDFSNLE